MSPKDHSRNMLTGVDPFTSFIYSTVKGEMLESVNSNIKEIRADLHELGNAASAIREMTGAIQAATKELHNLTEQLR